jgi:uncharacterized protein
LVDYIDILKTASIREIQVTLDGKGSVHDARRFLKGGGATFDKIVEGIDACLQNGLPVNLRMVVDKENISGLIPQKTSLSAGSFILFRIITLKESAFTLQ